MCGPSKTSQIQGKLLMKEANGSLFLLKTGHVGTVPLKQFARSILSGTPQFLWSNSKNEQEKSNHASSHTSGQIDRPKH